MTSTEIQSKINAYTQAKQETAHIELATEELRQTFERWLVANLPVTVREEYENFQESLKNCDTLASVARKNEEAAKKELVAVVEQHAAETGVRGREVHPHINIVNTSKVEFKDVPQAVSWLVEQGRAEDITIKTWKIDWFRAYQTANALPDCITLIDIPAVKIDKVWAD